jgi:hypothetical protein
MKTYPRKYSGSGLTFLHYCWNVSIAATLKEILIAVDDTHFVAAIPE